MRFKTLLAGMLGGVLMAATAGPVQAIPMLTGLLGSDGTTGPAGFGELSQPRNDDGSSSELNLPFQVNFFGQNFNTFYINNNGNITFGGPRGTFTPQPFPQTGNRPMIAPYWGDVDTRCSTCGEVYVGGGTDAAGNDFVAATWNNVGYYSRNTNRTNSFQAIIRERPDTGTPGDFDIDFRYERLEWTTGDASGGSGGLGGTPAQAGFDAANGSDFFTLPGSRTAAVLDLQNTSNVSPTTPGLWTFAIRNGGLPDGSSPSNPLLPVVTDDGFEFDFNVDLNQQIFIDPPVAIGYDYFVDSGPNVASVLVPAALPNGDSMFLLELPDGTMSPLIAGVEVDLLALDPLGYREFRISGIDVGEGLDPTDPLAFVTGLRFVTAGPVSMRQVPITIDVPGTAVPEPGTLLLLASGLVGLYARRRTRRA